LGKLKTDTAFIDGEAVKTWALRHGYSALARGVCFAPGGMAIVDGALNLWSGFGVAPAPGNWADLRGLMSAMVNNDPTQLNYLIRYLAHAVQHPQTAPGAMPLFTTPDGQAWGTLASVFVELWGHHADSDICWDGLYSTNKADAGLCMANVGALIVDLPFAQPRALASRHIPLMLHGRARPVQTAGAAPYKTTAPIRILARGHPNDRHAQSGTNSTLVHRLPPASEYLNTAFLAQLRRRLDAGAVLPAMMHDLMKLDLGN
jgi:hypothetical protein